MGTMLKNDHLLVVARWVILNSPDLLQLFYIGWNLVLYLLIIKFSAVVICKSNNQPKKIIITSN